MKKILLCVVFVFGLVQPTVAQIKLGTGGKGGTYLAMADNMVKMCGSEVTISVEETSGSFANIQGIVDNTLTSGISQFDVMRYSEDREPAMSRIKVLFPLHVEEIHIIGANKAYKEGGFMGFGARSVELNSIRDLSKRKVVAWGGSVLSAEYFAFRLKLDYEVVDISGTRLDEKGNVVKVAQGATPHLVAAKMIRDGDAHAIFAVGGSPVSWLRDDKVFGRQFKLLSIGSDIADQVAAVYNKARINYPNLTNGQAQTLGVQALFITRDYRTTDRAAALVRLRDCLVRNIDNLRDQPGMHPKWQVTDPSVKFDRWANYEAPASALSGQVSPVQPSPSTKKK